MAADEQCEAEWRAWRRRQPPRSARFHAQLADLRQATQCRLQRAAPRYNTTAYPPAAVVAALENVVATAGELTWCFGHHSPHAERDMLATLLTLAARGVVSALPFGYFRLAPWVYEWLPKPESKWEPKP